MAGGCRDYRQLLEKITNDPVRNAEILARVKAEAVQGHFCLVLSERISHIENLHSGFQSLCPGIKSACLTGEKTKTERENAIAAMNRGELKVLFGSKLADEGLDIQRLERVFLSCPLRSVNRVTQQIGRTLRLFPGKADAVVYDFLDDLIPLAESQFRTRRELAYRNYDIEFEHGN